MDELLEAVRELVDSARLGNLEGSKGRLNAVGQVTVDEKALEEVRKMLDEAEQDRAEYKAQQNRMRNARMQALHPAAQSFGQDGTHSNRQLIERAEHMARFVESGAIPLDNRSPTEETARA